MPRLGPPKGYTDILDEALLAKQREELAGPRKYSPLRPSAAGKCARALAHEYAQFKGLEEHAGEVKQPNIIRLLNLGHSIEWNFLNTWRDVVKDFPLKYKQQVLSFFKLPSGAFIEGSLDMVLWSPEHKAIGDVKSKGDKFSSYQDSQWNEIDEKLRSMKSVDTISDTAYWVEDLPAFLEELNDPFFSDNFVQLNMYANSDFIIDRGIDHAFILQYNKNNSKIREVRFKPSRDVYDYVVNKFTEVDNAITLHGDPTLVDKEANLGDFRCAYCPFNQKCWNHDAKRAFFDTLPKKSWPKDTNRLPVEVARQLEEIYDEYSKADAASKTREALEAELCGLLDEAQVYKVRFADGNVYDVKYLKSPKPHFELRRGKA